MSRRTVLFALAIVLPCSVLVLLTLRMLVQERELTDKRAADERRRLTDDIRQRLLAYVERLRLASERAPADIALVARVENGALRLPWESASATAASVMALEEPRFRALVSAGERHEFGDENFAAAASAYHNAAVAARVPVQRAAAHVLEARTLLKLRRGSEANQLARTVLAAPADLVDDQGVPYAVYAARQLSENGDGVGDRQAIVAMLGAVLESTLAPAAVYMIGDVARSLADDALTARVARYAQDVEQALELQRAFPRMALPAVTPGANPVWATFGSDHRKWLVSVGSAGVTVLTAVRAEPVMQRVDPAIRLESSGGDDTLAPNFPGLRAAVGDAALAAARAEMRLQRPFYLTALALVLSVTLFGAYLFWRDTRREMRLAEMRSQFVSSVSHELKTPLTAIRMFAETLMLGRSTSIDVQHEYLETIVNESERLTRLLNNVLDFSKIEQGKKTYRLEPLSPAAVVRAAAKSMHYPFAQQGFELRVRIDDDVPLVAGESDALEQALLNLLTNAMKYSGDSRAIDVVLERKGDTAVIAVTDRGIGIASAEHARIFERFYRVADDANRAVPGTGLGLTLVDHVVRGHGGRVLVRSAPGEGSTFSIVLPLLAPPALAEARALA